jgi:hypothetical protein
MRKTKKILKEIFEIENLPDKELYILLSIFALIVVLGLFQII